MEISMYPFYNSNEVWSIFIKLMESDIPFADVRNIFADFKKEFHEVFEEILEEHAAIRAKYYRDDNKRPFVNPLNTAHYTRLLYYYSHALFQKDVDAYILDQLFYSLKTRCNIDLFYEIELKKYFLPAHAISSILGRAQYSDYLVVTQNCTIGNNKGRYPKLGKGVILRSGAQILGDCLIGDNVTFAANSLVIDKDIPANSTVFGQGPNLRIKKNPEDNIDIYFER